MRSDLSRLQTEVSQWPGVTASPHRFGGVEFNLGTTEIGHFHSNGMVDIPFNSQLRNQLIAERLAEPHHLLKDTGWISFYLRADGDLDKAIRLFKLSYLFNTTRGRRRAEFGGVLDVERELAALNLSGELRAVFDHVTRRQSE